MHYAFPHRLAFPGLFDGHSLGERRRASVHLLDGIFEGGIDFDHARNYTPENMAWATRINVPSKKTIIGAETTFRAARHDVYDGLPDVLTKMPDDLRAIIASLLPDEGEDRLGAAVRDVMRPIVHDAFRRGLQIGLTLGRDAAARGFDAALRSINGAFDAPAAPAATHDAGRAVERAPTRGIIGPLIDKVLSAEPGLRASEIEQRVVGLDNNRSAGAVGNELRRQMGRRYRREGMRWFLIGNTGTRTPETGTSVVEGDLWATPPGQAAA